MMNPKSIARLGSACLIVVLGACGDEAPPFDVVGCRITDAQDIGADEAPLGFSARDVFEAWRVGPGPVLRFGSERYRGPAVDLELGFDSADLSRAQFVRKAQIIGGDFHPPCPQGLTFPVTVAVRSADGQFDERLNVNIYATRVDYHLWATDVQLAELAGSYDPDWPLPGQSWSNHDNTPRHLTFSGHFDGRATGSWGTLTLFAGYPDEDDTYTGGNIASWGEEPSDWQCEWIESWCEDGRVVR